MPTLLHYSDVENAFDRPERVARLAAALQTPADAVVVGSGDILAPGALANEHEGRQALPFLEAARPAAETFGNHDFDFGTDALQAIVKESPQPWVSANVTLPDVDIPQSVAVERNDGRISITGVTAPDAIGDWLDGVGSTDPVDAARQATDRLRRDCDYVVLLAHVGDETATTLAQETEADVVCAGHIQNTVKQPYTQLGHLNAPMLPGESYQPRPSALLASILCPLSRRVIALRRNHVGSIVYTLFRLRRRLRAYQNRLF